MTTVDYKLSHTPSIWRSRGLDGLRGLAILLMVGDHISLLYPNSTAVYYRFTLGRMAMPLFFIISGHLLKRVSWRHAVIAAIGLILPLVVPWIDSPNVLLIYSASTLVIVYARKYNFLPFVIALALTLSANHYIPNGRWFDPTSLLALMALGAMIPRTSFDWANNLPSFLTILGKYPLIIYVSHLLILEGLRHA